MPKQVTIYLSRKLTLSRHGHEAVVLEPGRNVVDADVAAHQFVKHFTVEAIDASPDEVAELRARVVELEEQLAQKEADLAALVASVTPAAEKPAKGK